MFILQQCFFLIEINLNFFQKKKVIVTFIFFYIFLLIFMYACIIFFLKNFSLTNVFIVVLNIL